MKVPLTIMIDIAHVLRIDAVWFVDKVLRDHRETIPLANWLFGRRGLLRAEYVSSSRRAESLRRGETAPSSKPMPETESVERHGSQERDAGDAERAGESETDDIDDAALQEPRGDDQPARAANEVMQYRLEGTLNISTRRPTDKSKT